MCIYIYIYIHIYTLYMEYAYVFLYICKMNDSHDTRDGREELGIFCYKGLPLFMKQYDAIRKCAWISCKLILQTLGQPIKKQKKEV